MFEETTSEINRLLLNCRKGNRFRVPSVHCNSAGHLEVASALLAHAVQWFVDASGCEETASSAVKAIWCISQFDPSAAQMLENRAAHFSAVARYRIGASIEEFGTDAAKVEAVHWYRLAAEKNSDAAFDALDRMSAERSDAMAALHALAEGGNATACFHIAELLLHQPQIGDLDAIWRWYVKAATGGCHRAFEMLEARSRQHPEVLSALLSLGDAGDSRAQFFLGKHFACTEDPKSLEQGVTWYKKAAKSGCSTSVAALGKIAEWYPPAFDALVALAEDGISEAFAFIGERHWNRGRFADAVQWFHRGAELGSPTAALRLGSAYRTGQGVDADQNEAAKWLNRGAAGSKLITDLEFSVRSRKALQRLNISTVAQLTSKTEAYFLAMKNFGQTSLLEIHAQLKLHGLKLRDA